MMTKTITGGNFTNPAGAALNGNLLLVLSQDAKVAAQSGLVAPTSVRLPITSGSISPTLVYFNDELLPGNTTYTATAYDATGNKVYGPEIVSLAGAGPLDLGTLVPLLISPDPLFSNPVLQGPAVPQTITGQGLTLTTTAPLTVQGTSTFTGASTFTGVLSSTTALNATTLNNVQMCDQFAGATADVKIAACIAALPAAGGVADARGIIGAQSFASTLTIGKQITLLLGSARITGPTSGDMIDVTQPGVIIKGMGAQGSTAASTATVLIPVTSAQAHGINFTTTNNANTQYKVQDLTINDSTAGGTARTAGDGIRASANANPAQNSIGQIDNVWISFMFNGINLIRPITSVITHVTLVSNANDGFRVQGDGTSTWCMQCYSNHSGRHNFSFWGMNYSGILAGASDNAQKDGYRIDNCANDGNSPPCPGGQVQSLAMTISGGAEVDCQTGGAGCAGVHLVDAIGVELYGQKILNSKGYGLWMNGARGVSAHGFITGSISNDVQLDCSPTPQCGGGVLLNNLVFTTSGGGQIGSGFTQIGWNGSSSAFQSSIPPTSVGGTANVTGTGACATVSTQSGGLWAGRVTCTGVTAASTLVITPGPTAPNGFICTAFDQTTRANLLQQTATTTTACTLTATSITQNDVIVFQAIEF